MTKWKCWGCGVEVEADARPTCPTPKCGIPMDKKHSKARAKFHRFFTFCIWLVSGVTWEQAGWLADKEMRQVEREVREEMMLARWRVERDRRGDGT